MPYWVQSLYNRGGQRMISLPIDWQKSVGITPASRYVFAEDNGDGVLIIMTEEAWHDKRAKKLIARANR